MSVYSPGKIKKNDKARSGDLILSYDNTGIEHLAGGALFYIGVVSLQGLDLCYIPVVSSYPPGVAAIAAVGW